MPARDRASPAGSAHSGPKWRPAVTCAAASASTCGTPRRSGTAPVLSLPRESIVGYALEPLERAQDRAPARTRPARSRAGARSREPPSRQRRSAHGLDGLGADRPVRMGDQRKHQASRASLIGVPGRDRASAPTQQLRARRRSSNGAAPRGASEAPPTSRTASATRPGQRAPSSVAGRVRGSRAPGLAVASILAKCAKPRNRFEVARIRRRRARSGILVVGEIAAESSDHLVALAKRRERSSRRDPHRGRLVGQGQTQGLGVRCPGSRRARATDRRTRRTRAGGVLEEQELHDLERPGADRCSRAPGRWRGEPPPTAPSTRDARSTTNLLGRRDGWIPLGWTGLRQGDQRIGQGADLLFFALEVSSSVGSLSRGDGSTRGASTWRRA